MSSKKTLSAGLMALVLMIMGVCGSLMAEDQKAAEQSLTIIGSTTVGPIAEGFAEAFKQSHPGLKVTVEQPGSGVGATALIEGRCQVATMSRFMKDKEEFQLAVSKGITPVAHVIAIDGICVVVHPSNPVKALTLAQIKDIYTGKITNWKEVGGSDAAIVVMSRDTASGTYETFDHFVMKKEKMAAGVQYASSNPEIKNRVANTAGAMGYIGVGFVDEKVKALTVDKIEPSKQNILSGKYPLSRPLFLFTNGYPAMGSTVYQFCTFHLTEQGQQIIEEKGFLPLTHY